MSLEQSTEGFDVWFPTKLWVAAGKVICAKGFTTLSELTRFALIESTTLPEACPLGRLNRGLNKRVKIYLRNPLNLKVQEFATAAQIDRAEVYRRIVAGYVTKSLQEIQDAKTKK